MSNDPSDSNTPNAQELKLNEYPSLATSVDVDLNFRLGGVLLDLLFSIPLLYLSTVIRFHLIGAVLDCAYWLSRDAFLGGQSFGKRLVKERVVKLDGSRFRWIDSALRNIAYLPSFIISITAFLWVTPELLPLANGSITLVALAEILCVVITKRRIGDFIARTKVVHADAPVKW